ncbi:MAG: FG-GAP-like repeat-containing protein [candidate division WOR-3 bacterium]
MIGMIGIFIGATTVNWPCWGGDPERQGLQTTPGAFISAPSTKWKVQTYQLVRWEFSAIADVDGDGQMEVLVGCYNGYPGFFCINGSTGTVEWSVNTYLSGVLAGPAVADVDNDGQNEVIFASSGSGAGDDTVYCYSGMGSRKWAFCNPSSGRYWSSPAIVDLDGDGNMEVLIGNSDGGTDTLSRRSLYCLNGSNGTQKWSYISGNSVDCASPSAADVDGDGKLEVLFVNWANRLFCISDTVVAGNDTCRVEWTYPFGASGGIQCTPVLLDLDGDGKMEIVTANANFNSNNLYCLNTATISGNDTAVVKWTFSAGRYIYSSLSAADADGNGIIDVFVGSWDSLLYCLDGATGAKKWQFGKVPEILYTPISVMDADGAHPSGDPGLEVLLTAKDTLYCVNAEDGSLLWKARVAPRVNTPFSGDIDGDGASEIIVGADSALYALDTASPVYEGIGDNNNNGDLVLFRFTNNRFYLYLPEEDGISIALYDAGGRFVKSIFEGHLSSGSHNFELSSEAKGVYIAVLRHNEGIKTLKIAR